MTDTSLQTLTRRGFVLISAGSVLSACVSMPTNKGMPSGTRDETAAALPMVRPVRRLTVRVGLKLDARMSAAVITGSV